MQDGWSGDTKTSAPPVVDDRPVASSAGSYGLDLTDALLKVLETSSSSSKGEATKSSIENGTNTAVVNPGTSADKWPDDISEDEAKKLAELLNSLVNSQNEVNTISQVISTSEKYFEIGKENYKNATDEISAREAMLDVTKDAWAAAKTDMDSLRDILKNKLDTAEERLLNATTESERLAAQTELDNARKEWDDLCKKMLEYAAQEIKDARALGDKNLEKQWQDCYDHLYDDDSKIKSSLDSLSENMKQYIATGNDEYHSKAQIADANYREASADADYTIGVMKNLESASVAYVQYLLDQAKELLELSKSDLATSLDQAQKAFEMAQLAAETANRLAEQAKGTPYEEQAKLVAQNARTRPDGGYYIVYDFWVQLVVFSEY